MLKRHQQNYKFFLQESMLILVSLLILSPPCSAVYSQILPENIEYLGAFRLPDGTNQSDWGYSGNALTYSRDGDKSGPDDGFPGSLFSTGNDTHLHVSEISIPVPKKSANKNVKDLNTAKTIQRFSPVFNQTASYLELPRAGLSYLPGKNNDNKGKLLALPVLMRKNIGCISWNPWPIKTAGPLFTYFK